MKAGKYARFEIERRFTLEKLPAVDEYVIVHDTYIEGSRLRLRIVKSKDGEVIHRKLTQKQFAPGRDPSFTVISTIYLSASDLKALGDLKGISIEKRRYTLGPSKVVDLYPDGRILAEVEFADEDARDAFEVPEGWTEITGDPKFTGAALAGVKS